MAEKIRRGQLSFWVNLSDVAEVSDPRAQRNSSALETLPYFCTSANMKTATVYLSQELQSLGLSCPLVEVGGQRVNLVALVNACWEVTQLYKSAARDSSTLHEQKRRDTADLKHFQSTTRDLRGTVEERERQVCEAREKERQAIDLTKTLATKLRTEKEESRKLNNVIQQREAHHQHELRKKESENSRLRERLHRLISGDRSSEVRPPSLSLSSSLTRHNHSRARWKTESTSARYEEDLQRRVLGQYESWVGQLNNENDQLKTLLSSVSSQLTKITDRHKLTKVEAEVVGDLNTSLESSNYSTDSLENVVMSLEFPAFRDQMYRLLNHNITTITQALEDREVREEAETQPKTAMEDLKKQLIDAREHLAKHTLSEGKDPPPESPTEPSFLGDSHRVEEELDLNQMKESVKAERRALQHDRHTFTEATIRLNRERASFEAEKVELLRRQFLMDLPSSLAGESDLPTTALESGGSMSSGGSAGDVFDSPHRLLSAAPSLTPPHGNITFIHGSPPPVLGPSLLTKQHPHHMSPGQRLRSAPGSRCSSIPRQLGGNDAPGSYTASRIPLPRPRTLERDKPLRSRSYSRGEVPGDVGSGRRLLNLSCSPRRSMSHTLSPPRLSVQEYGHLCLSPARDTGRSSPGHSLSPSRDINHTTNRTSGPYSLSPSRDTSHTTHRASGPYSLSPARDTNYKSLGDYQDPLCSTTQSTSQVARKLMLPVTGCQLYQFANHQEDGKPETKQSVEALEADLASLMDQLSQRYHGPPGIPSPPHSESPPPYEEVVPPKPRPRQLLSLMKSAPGSLSGSRRSSQDLGSDLDKKKLPRRSYKNSNQS